MNFCCCKCLSPPQLSSDSNAILVLKAVIVLLFLLKLNGYDQLKHIKRIHQILKPFLAKPLQITTRLIMF